MKIKRFAVMLLAVIMIFSCMAMSASAAEGEGTPDNNHDDCYFSFAFDNWGRSNTLRQEKRDDSGTYIVAYQMCNGGFDVYVDGYDSVSGKWVDCTDKLTRGQPHLRTTNYPGLISQWVNEKGYRYARLGGYKLLSSSPVTGDWSPDTYSTKPIRYLGSST